MFILILKIIGIIVLVIISLIALIIFLVLSDHKKTEKMITTIEDINHYWNVNLPSSNVITKDGRTLCIKYKRDTAEKFTKWISEVKHQYSLQFCEGKEALDGCLAESLMFLDYSNIIGTLMLYAGTEQMYGNFFIQKDCVYLMYGIDNTSFIDNEMKDIGCPLPKYNILSILYQDTFTDYSSSALVKFDKPISEDYYNKLAIACETLQEWKFNNTQERKGIERHYDVSNFVNVSFYIDDGNQMGRFSWGRT